MCSIQFLAISLNRKVNVLNVSVNKLNSAENELVALYSFLPFPTAPHSNKGTLPVIWVYCFSCDTSWSTGYSGLHFFYLHQCLHRQIPREWKQFTPKASGWLKVSSRGRLITKICGWLSLILEILKQLSCSSFLSHISLANELELRWSG